MPSFWFGRSLSELRTNHLQECTIKSHRVQNGDLQIEKILEPKPFKDAFVPTRSVAGLAGQHQIVR
jgi:hypothetical protein